MPCIHSEWAILDDDVGAASRGLIFFYWNTAICPTYSNDRVILCLKVEINCNDIFMRHIFWSTCNAQVIAQSRCLPSPAITANQNKYSLLMHRMKIKSPAIFFMEWIKRFCRWIYHFSISLTLVVLQRQKSLPHIGGTSIQDVVGHLDWNVTEVCSQGPNWQ